MLRTLALAALGLVRVWAGGHGHEHLAVVRVFSTDEEVMLLNGSKMHWDTVVPCTTKSNMSAIDLILVYSKDLASNSMANEVVMDIVNGFQMKMDMEMYGSTNVTMGTMYDWMECFSAIKSMSAMLNPEQDVYDSNGYTTNKHWVSGPNHVFKNILDAMFKGAYMDMYDSFFLMEMDAVPIKSNWLDQFEMEAHEVHDNNQAVRGSQYLGDKWDLFKHQMPVYLVDHINGNAIYNLKHPWTRYLYDTFTMVGDASMMEEMAFDVAFAMITMAAMSGDPMYSTNWTGDNMTYNTHTMLVGNYANTLLNTSYEFGTYIRHGSGKNLFENLDDDDVTLGVAYFDHQGHFMETVPTHHPFKKILGITYFNQPNSTQTIVAPDGNVTMMMQTAMYGPYYHLCEIAKLVDTEWFALTDNYHIVKAPVSVLMDESGEMKKPVLPYVLKDSKYCGERPNCKASMEQAEDLFSINLNYHHDKYEVLYKTADARMFCDAWDAATEGKSWGNCSLAFGPTADDYIAWKISDPKYNIADEFTPKDKTRYGWRAWTSLWNPAPVDDRMCDTTLYGVKEYLETLGNISTCAVDYVEDPAGCMASTHCMWRPMFESGVCLLNPMSVMPTTTVEGAVYSVVETTVELTVADAQAIMDDTDLTTAMRTEFATLVDVTVDKVMLEFQTSRRLSNNIRRLSEKLYAIFTVTMDSVADAESKQVAIETLSLAQTTEAITKAAQDAGYTGSMEVVGKMTSLVPAPTTTTTTTTTTTAATDSNTTTTTMMSTTEALPQPSFAQHFGSFSVLALLAAAFMN